jgi:hypothetical protein
MATPLLLRTLFSGCHGRHLVNAKFCDHPWVRKYQNLPRREPFSFRIEISTRVETIFHDFQSFGGVCEPDEAGKYVAMTSFPLSHKNCPYCFTCRPDLCRRAMTGQA